MMKLIKRDCKKQGFEKYFDLILTWEHDGKVYDIKIQPVFKSEYKFLIAHAENKQN